MATIRQDAQLVVASIPEHGYLDVQPGGPSWPTGPDGPGDEITFLGNPVDPSVDTAAGRVADYVREAGDHAGLPGIDTYRPGDDAYPDTVRIARR